MPHFATTRFAFVVGTVVALVRLVEQPLPAQSVPNVAPEARAGSNASRAEGGEKRLNWKNKAQATTAPSSNEREPSEPSASSEQPAEAPALRIIEVEAPTPRPVTRSSALMKSTSHARRTRLEDPTAESLPEPDVDGGGDFPPNILREPNGRERLIPPAPAADDPWKVAPPPRNPVDPIPRMRSPAAQVQYQTEPQPDELWGLPREFEPKPYQRYEGRGEPLTAGSWLNRPLYFGVFIGGISGDTLVQNSINQNAGVIAGVRFGWDYDHYWGLESRAAFATQGLEFADYPTLDGISNDLILWDFNLIYYPWGDSRWRPFFSAGAGIADYDFVNPQGIRRSEMVFSTPIAAGLKYRMNQYWSWRFDVTDNIIWGGAASFELQNELSFTSSIECRFGGTRRSYWPWNPSNRYR